jgi:hypothetical protein
MRKGTFEHEEVWRSLLPRFAFGMKAHPKPLRNLWEAPSTGPGARERALLTAPSLHINFRYAEQTLVASRSQSGPRLVTIERDSALAGSPPGVQQQARDDFEELARHELTQQKPCWAKILPGAGAALVHDSYSVVSALNTHSFTCNGADLMRVGVYPIVASLAMSTSFRCSHPNSATICYTTDRVALALVHGSNALVGEHWIAHLVGKFSRPIDGVQFTTIGHDVHPCLSWCTKCPRHCRRARPASCCWTPCNILCCTLPWHKPGYQTRKRPELAITQALGAATQRSTMGGTWPAWRQIGAS